MLRPVTRLAFAGYVPAMRLILSLLIGVLLPFVANADQVLQYEPTVVQVTGTVAKGKREHPNGTWFDFYVIKLATPVSIKGDGGKDSFNVDEKDVKEIQVFSTDDAVLKQIGKMEGKKVVIAGTIFHAHTAWHVRELVMTVREMMKSE
jgi:hypothetical protein